MNRGMHSKEGFTLIEVLSVLAILGILMGLLFPAFGQAKLSVRKKMSHIVFIECISALHDYQLYYGHYPTCVESVETPVSIHAIQTAWIQSLQGKNDAETNSYNPDNRCFREFKDSEFNANGDWVDALGNSEIYIVRRADNALKIPQSVFPERIREHIPADGLSEKFAIFSIGKSPEEDILSW